MASAAPKFRILTPRILVVSTAVFISLSGVSTVPIGPRRCYWCGPLADPVHRSVRAPSCEESQEHVTTCETGLTHCATIATAPSQSEEIRDLLNFRTGYVVSRLCVKSYVADCYYVYCNVTQMFSMICPCLDDLCNGPNTSREKKAFAILLERAKNRKKRELITSHTFKGMENITAMRIINIDDNDSAEDIQSDEPINDVKYTYENESNALNENLFKQDSVNTSIEHDIDEIKENKAETDLQTTAASVNVTDESFAVTEESVKLSSTQHNEPSVVQNNMLPSAQLPLAESLQQNVTPTGQTAEQTSIATTIASTPETLGVTLEPNITGKRNNGAQLYIHIFILIVCVVMHYYI